MIKREPPATISQLDFLFGGHSSAGFFLGDGLAGFFFHFYNGPSGDSSLV